MKVKELIEELRNKERANDSVEILSNEGISFVKDLAESQYGIYLIAAPKRAIKRETGRENLNSTDLNNMPITSIVDTTQGKKVAGGYIIKSPISRGDMRVYTKLNQWTDEATGRWGGTLELAQLLWRVTEDEAARRLTRMKEEKNDKISFHKTIGGLLSEFTNLSKETDILERTVMIGIWHIERQDTYVKTSNIERVEYRDGHLLLIAEGYETRGVTPSGPDKILNREDIDQCKGVNIVCISNQKAVSVSVWEYIKKYAFCEPVGVEIQGDYPLVVALDEPDPICWSCSEGIYDLETGKDAKNYGDFNGEHHTRKAPIEGINSAIGYCKRYSKSADNGQGIGMGDWWLPSSGELHLIRDWWYDINFVLGILSNLGYSTRELQYEPDYWSSTERSSTEAETLCFRFDTFGYQEKTTDCCRARPVTKLRQRRPQYNGLEFVDLGLGVMWAAHNIGADNPRDYGDYFAWGETKTKESYDKYTDERQLLKVCSLYKDKDAAYIKWGGKWRMPTEEDFRELLENCDYEWTRLDGVSGGKFTSRRNGGWIFFPAAGWRYGKSLRGDGVYGGYWSSTPSENDFYNAYCLNLLNDNCFISWGHKRTNGKTIRPVVRRSDIDTK